jgi:hypothetical protein
MQSGIDDFERADVSLLAFEGVSSINNNTKEADQFFFIRLSVTQLKIVNLSAFVK